MMIEHVANRPETLQLLLDNLIVDQVLESYNTISDTLVMTRTYLGQSSSLTFRGSLINKMTQILHHRHTPGYFQPDIAIPVLAGRKASLSVPDYRNNNLSRGLAYLLYPGSSQCV